MPQTLYFGVNDDGRLVGAVTVRHGLDRRNRYDGHVGFGVRPSERRKGYAKAMLALALERLEEMGIRDVLLTCAAGNTGSERTMLACGAVYERTVRHHGERIKLFWVHR